MVSRSENLLSAVCIPNNATMGNDDAVTAKRSGCAPTSTSLGIPYFQPYHVYHVSSNGSEGMSRTVDRGESSVQITFRVWQKLHDHRVSLR